MTWEPWVAWVAAGFAGFGVGIGVVLGAFLTRIVARYLREDQNGNA